MNRFQNRARIVCFDTTPDPTAGDQPKTFTQEDLNKILAEDRRKHQAQIAKIQQTLEATASDKAAEAQAKEQLKARLDELETSLLTKDQQAAREKKIAEDKLTTEAQNAKKEAGQWREKFNEALIDRSLTEAAAATDVFSVQQVKALLRNNTKLEQQRDPLTGQLTEVFVPKVTFEDRDENGNVVQTTTDPESALKKMRILTGVYGNLFKSGVVSGVGSSSATGGTGMSPGANGKLTNDQIARLTPAQYQEIRAKHPEQLGLRRNEKRRT